MGRKGFTLAEILITIGIIGVISAITIPVIITQYRIVELRTRFQKTNSVINQALKSTLNEFGMDNFSDMNLFNLKSGEQASVFKPRYEEFNKVWEKQFNAAQKVGRQEIANKQRHLNLSTHPLFTKTYWGAPASWGHLYPSPGNLTPTYYILPDGSLVGQIDAVQTCYASCTIATIFFDTNGPYKGPNRYGYDFFYFDAGINGKSIYTCKNNEYGCFYQYAVKNQNPFYPEKEYWNSLYKPKSYFEKSK